MKSTDKELELVGKILDLNTEYKEVWLSAILKVACTAVHDNTTPSNEDMSVRKTVLVDSAGKPCLLHVDSDIVNIAEYCTLLGVTDFDHMTDLSCEFPRRLMTKSIHTLFVGDTV